MSEGSGAKLERGALPEVYGLDTAPLVVSFSPVPNIEDLQGVSFEPYVALRAEYTILGDSSSKLNIS